MRILTSLFFCIALTASELVAGPPAPPQPIIHSVVPDLGPTSGGTTVTITGGFFGLPTGFACILPCPPRVFFGESLSTLEKESDVVLVVKTAPHFAGRVDVTVVTGDSRTVTARDGFLYEDPAVAPSIRSITPAIGTSNGGTLVTIAGNHLGLPPGFACLLPCPAKVTFGDVPATLEQETDTALIVKTPPHDPGGVDVKVLTGDGRSTTARDGFVYADNSEAAYERMLFPIYLESRVAGSDGTLWETQLWLRDNGANGVTLAPWACPRDAFCPPVFPLTRTLQPGETLQNLPEITQSNPGRVLFVNKDGAVDLSFGLRLFEISQSDRDAGTEIPVVRENELLSRTAHLHNVPLNGRSRIMLRIYDLVAEKSRFRVRVYEEAAGVSNALPLIELELTATSPETGTFRFHPAYAEYGALSNLLVSPVPRPSSLRVDVEPLTAGSRYWTFVSITNNDTQRVTLITPQ